MEERKCQECGKIKLLKSFERIDCEGDIDKQGVICNKCTGI